MHLFERMVSTGSVLRTLGETRAGEVAAQRWLSSPRVSVEVILEGASARTVEACRGRRVLVSQDTTEINFERWARREGLGPGGNGKTPGFFIHPLVAVDIEDEAVLGLVGAQILDARRGAGELAQGPAPWMRRESRRWTEGSKAAAERLAGAACRWWWPATRRATCGLISARRPEAARTAGQSSATIAEA